MVLANMMQSSSLLMLMIPSFILLLYFRRAICRAVGCTGSPSPWPFLVFPIYPTLYTALFQHVHAVLITPKSGFLMHGYLNHKGHGRGRDQSTQSKYFLIVQPRFYPWSIERDANESNTGIKPAIVLHRARSPGLFFDIHVVNIESSWLCISASRVLSVMNKPPISG